MVQVSGRLALVLGASLALGACAEGQKPFGFLKRGQTDAGETSTTDATGASVRLVENDVEAPDVYQVTESGLWDGRPSLGGVWVAAPDVKDPERVIIRNTDNGKFVIGALFRRERDNPGPTLQISSDAAAALGLLAGQPGRVSVTALRREDGTGDAAPDASRPILDAAETVQTTALDASAGAVAPAAQPVGGTVAIATAALDSVDGTAARTAAIPDTKAAATPKAPLINAPVAAATAATAATAAPAAGTGGLVQIGIFSVEANARRATDTLAKAGITASIRQETAQGKSFWSVTARGDAAALAKIRAAGFADAYALKR